MVERNELQATKSRGGTLGAKSCLIKACRKGHTLCGSSLVTFRKRQNSGDNSSDGCGGWGREGRRDHDAGPRCQASVCRRSGGHMAFLICPGRSKRRPGPPSGEPWTLGERSRSSEQVTHPSPPAAAAPSLRNPGPPLPARVAPSSLRPAPPLRPRLAAPRPAMLCPASSLCSEPLEAGTAGSSQAAVAACRDVAVPGSLCAPPRAGREAGCALPSPHRGLCSLGSAPMGRGGPSSPTFCPPCCF